VSEVTDNEGRPVAEPAPVLEAIPDRSVRRRSAWVRWLTLGLLSVMLLVLVVVVFVLPDLVAERVAIEHKPEPVIVPAAPSPPAEDARRIAREKREAERLLGALLRKQTELEGESVAAWGGEDYDAALDTLAAGDAELQAERYQMAAAHYESAIRQFDALAASRPERSVAALEAGDAALAAGDGPAARGNYAIALAIDGQNARAREGMARARVLEDVLALIAAGAAHEARDQLQAAKESYAAALALDGQSSQARDAHELVAERIRDREFRAAMSTALEALDRGDFGASRDALGRAGTVKEESPEVADARRRLQLAVQASQIATHRREAKALERSERWSEAADHYAAVLAIDANAAFARAGRERSLARARIHAELDAYLDEIHRLSAAAPRENARRLLAAADADAAAEPRLVEKRARLAKAIEIAETPMKVRLASDNLTDVAVYKVGRFGRFESHDLLLPPGTYVAVGKRTGYRDVRVEFTLTAGDESAYIVVRCQEKI